MFNEIPVFIHWRISYILYLLEKNSIHDDILSEEIVKNDDIAAVLDWLFTVHFLTY